MKHISAIIPDVLRGYRYEVDRHQPREHFPMPTCGTCGEKAYQLGRRHTDGETWLYRCPLCGALDAESQAVVDADTQTNLGL